MQSFRLKDLIFVAEQLKLQTITLIHFMIFGFQMSHISSCLAMYANKTAHEQSHCFMERPFHSVKLTV